VRYLAVICTLLASLSVAFAQGGSATSPRTVTLEPSIPNDLVSVVKLTLDGVEVKPGIPFPAGDDWFGQIGIVIENISAKKIVFVAGQLRFPETGGATAEHLAVMARISIGLRPRGVREGRRPDDVPSVPILVDPSQEVTVPVVEDVQRIKKMIESRRPSSSVTTCAIGINTLYFEDGTDWLSPGLYFRADPNTPGRWVRISRKEFDAYQN
jgi:hypothetical protein